MIVLKDSFQLEVLVFEERGKPEYPEKTLSDAEILKGTTE